MQSGNEHEFKLVLKYWFIQKVLRVNSHVPWPVHWTSAIRDPEKIQRGTRTPGLGRGCHIDGRNSIKFGENVWIGPYVSLISMNHDVNDFRQYKKSSPIIINRDCWLGARSIILPGVELGDHTIVAAGAVVNRSFPDGNQVLAGVPAKIVKRLPKYGYTNIVSG
ncbi:acyltransferase [Thermodesulfobacteriota bacterium]